MADVVRQRVQELYQNQDPAVKKVADAALQEFQGTRAAWSICQEFLGDPDESLQFFAAQTLYSKVQQIAKGYDQASDIDLRDFAAGLQRHLGCGATSQQAKQRLVLALAALAVHLCIGTWRGAVADLLVLSDQQPQHAWCALVGVPEQLSSVVHTYVKTDKRTEALLVSAEALITRTLHLSPASADDAVTGTISDSPFSLAMQALVQWSKVMGLPLAMHDGFATHLVNLLQGPAGSSEVVLDVVLEVLRSSPGSFAIYEGSHPVAPSLASILTAITASMQALLPRIQEMTARPATSMEDSDGQRLSRWARVAGTLIESFTQILWVEVAAAEVVIAFLGACFVVHPHVAQSVFELWAILKDANRDSKLPAGVLPGLLQRLAPPCITSLERFGRHDSPYADDVADLMQLRSAQEDILVDMYCIADGIDEAQQIVVLLCDHLQRFEGAKDWHGVEVCWFAFRGIAEVLVDEPSLPSMYQAVLQSVFRAELPTEEHCATAANLLRACGPHFNQTVLPQLVPAVQWLIGVMARIPEVASEALQEICGYAGQHLLPHVQELLKVIIAAAPSLPAEVDVALHGALVGIVRGLPGDQAVAAFLQLCDGTARTLAAGINVQQEAGRQELHRCLCRLLRCTLVMREGGMETGPQQPTIAAGQISPAAQVAAVSLAQVISSQWNALSPPCRKLLCAAPVTKDALKGKPIFEFSDTALQVNIIALLRHAARAANETPPSGHRELQQRLVQLAAACCEDGQFAALVAVATLAGDPEFARAQIVTALGGVCQVTQRHIQAGAQAEQLIPVLDLISALAASVGEDLFATPQLPLLTELCVHALGSEDHDVLKPALLFIQKLLMSRSQGAVAYCGSGGAIQVIVRAVLAHFHKWPRMLGMNTFKLFSALLERHEAIVVSLATSPDVPCIVSLQPAEREIAHKGFQNLRGPKLRAFLGDLGAVARRENSADILQAYVL